MPEPIRVLHIITRMVKGGAQENTLANVLGFSAPGWECSLATGPALGPEGSLEPECLAAGVRMLRIPELVRELSPFQDLRAVQRLIRLCQKERPHIVHTHTSKAGILGRIAARRAGVPIVVHTPHGHVFHSYGSQIKTKVFIGAERHCAPMADRLVALTPNERQEHLELGVGRVADWSIVHSGINFEPFEAGRAERRAARKELGLTDETPVIGTVGRLVPIKGQRYLIDAFARLASQGSRAHLLLVGDGELRDELLDDCYGRGLRVVKHYSRELPPKLEVHESWEPTVHFVGLRRDVPRLMSAMDLFTLPSLNEGMGRVLVEAMAMELPCVASRVSGIPDVVLDGETGCLVAPRDPEALANALSMLLADPRRAQAMGRRGRERVVPEFGAGRMLEKLEGIYRELLRAKGIAVPVDHPNIETVGQEIASRPG